MNALEATAVRVRNERRERDAFVFMGWNLDVILDGKIQARDEDLHCDWFYFDLPFRQFTRVIPICISTLKTLSI